MLVDKLLKILPLNKKGSVQKEAENQYRSYYQNTVFNHVQEGLTIQECGPERQRNIVITISNPAHAGKNFGKNLLR